MPSKFVTKCVSTLFSVSGKDMLRGLLIAVCTGIGSKISFANLTALPSLAEWKAAGAAAIVAGLSYLGKQFFSGPKKA